MTCSVSQSVHVGTSWKLKIPANLNIFGLKSGINGGFTGDTNGVTNSQSRSIALGAGECGYFTFLPIDESVCGTYTTSQFTDTKQSHPNECTRDVQTVGNACVTGRQTYKDSSWVPWTKKNTIRGDTIFVRTNCGDRQRLPLDQQDDAYKHEGVSLDQGLYDGYAAFWDNGAENQAAALVMNDDNTDCAQPNVQSNLGSEPIITPVDYAQYDDCVDAITQLLDTPYEQLPIMMKQQYTVQEVGSCKIAIQYLQDWAAECKVSWVEVAAAATTFINSKCLDVDGKRTGHTGNIAGSQAMRTGNKCKSNVAIIGTS